MNELLLINRSKINLFLSTYVKSKSKPLDGSSYNNVVVCLLKTNSDSL